MIYPEPNRRRTTMSDNKKLAVVFFSHAGQNYSNGKIVDLKTGNTAVVAQKIATLTGADTFEIRTTQTYPFIYKECTDVAQTELRANSRPQLAEAIDVSGYDAIILGYPNWWGTMPMAVFTFLEGRELFGKTILPFCTHEGSGMGRSEADIRRLCPDCDVRAGLAIHGSSVSAADAAVKAWLEKNL